MYQDYKLAVQLWQAKDEAEQYDVKLRINETNKTTVNAFCDVRFPTRDVDEQHVATFIQNCVQHWAEYTDVQKEEVFEAFVIDFTVPGFKYSRSKLRAIGEAASRLAATPRRSCAIVFAPNVGDWGDEYSHEGMLKAQADVEKELRDSERRMSVQRFQLVFDPDTVPTQSRRPLYHTGWMCISDATHPDGKFVSEFAKSKLWVRQVVLGVPMLPQKNYVCPFSKAADRLGLSSSKGARRKQWLAGHQLAGAMREHLWCGMQLTPASSAAIIALIGYDVSIAESMIRSKSLAMPREMLATVVFAQLDVEVDNCNSNICQWLVKAQRRLVQQCCTEKVLIIDNWTSPTAYSASSVRPAYRDDDFKLICPSSTGHMPMRTDWMELTLSKLQLTESKELLQEIVKKHDVVHNPSGKLFTPATRKRDAESELPKDEGELLKTNPDDPKNSEELTAKDGPLITQEFEGQKLFITNSGQIWIWGES